MMKRIALVVAVTAGLPLLASGTALAQRKSPLADAPAVRKRVEMRSTRLEIRAGLTPTFDQTFYNQVFFHAGLAFHINDWLAISAFGAFNITQFDTSLKSKLIDQLPTSSQAMATPPDRAPTQATALNAMNKIGQIYAAQLELTPFSGKYSLFGKIFANYDFYVFGGPAYVNLVAASGNPAGSCTGTLEASCTVTGGRIAGTFGVGMHSYFNRFLGLNIELRDVMFKDNPAGLDVDGDRGASNADLTWGSNVMVSVGLSLLVPPTPSISP